MSAQPEQMNGSTSGTSAPKRTARLGPTEVVVLPNSDSEDEEVVSVGEDGDEGDQGDFLKDYPEDTEVNYLSSLPVYSITAN
jgi:hypothetical protein